MRKFKNRTEKKLYENAEKLVSDMMGMKLGEGMRMKVDFKVQIYGKKKQNWFSRIIDKINGYVSGNKKQNGGKIK